MSANDRFYIETSDFLGFKYEQFRNELYAKALSTPSEYFKLRKEVLETVKNQAIQDMYKQFYNLLSKGQDINGNDISTLGEPAYPSQLVSKFSFKAARTLEAILNEAIEILLPVDFKKLSERRLEDQSKESF